MTFNINNAGAKSNAVYKQIKTVLSRSVDNSNSKVTGNAFKAIARPSFSLSSSNKNVSYKKVNQTKNG